MLPLLDPQLRLVLLHHLALSLARAGPEQVGAAGLTPEQLARLPARDDLVQRVKAQLLRALPEALRRGDRP